MNARLQAILIAGSLLFLVYIIIMIIKRRVELKYVLVWLFTGVFLLIAAVFPGFAGYLSGLLCIVEPVNSLFLLVIFLSFLILFTLTIAISRNANRVKTMVQEVGIIKIQLEKLMMDLGKNTGKDSSNTDTQQIMETRQHEKSAGPDTPK